MFRILTIICDGTIDDECQASECAKYAPVHQRQTARIFNHVGSDVRTSVTDEWWKICMLNTRQVERNKNV